jgi:hypothetical protein
VILEQKEAAPTHIQEARQTVIISEKTLAAVAIVLAVAAGVMAYWAEREARMLQYYVLEMDAKLISHGIKPPEDSVAKQLHKGDAP